VCAVGCRRDYSKYLSRSVDISSKSFGLQELPHLRSADLADMNVHGKDVCMLLREAMQNAPPEEGLRRG